MADYSDDQKQHNVGLYREHGASATSKLTGVPLRTITRWAKDAGAVPQASREKTQIARATAAESVAKEWREYRTAEARGSGAAALTIRRTILDAAAGTPVRGPTGEVLIRRITDNGVEIPYVEVNGRNLQSLAISYGIMIDKAELLSGHATERVETWARGELDANLRDLVEEFEDTIRKGNNT